MAILVGLVRESNAKVSDGSQPPATSASPLGVPAGARSLDRLVGLPLRWIYPQETGRRKNPAGAASVIVVVGSWSKADGVNLVPDAPMTGRFHVS